ncbi:MAG: SMC-Scp complex subunit ScpB [Bacteroidetes bacterium]|nr:SMC-Scp complex subunit ScpB [Bacteroidota bacterium]
MEKDTLTLKPTSVRATPRAKRLVEAYIFGSNEPITVKEIIEITKFVNETLEESKRIELDSKKIDSIVNLLNEEYNSVGRSYQIVKLAGGYTFATLKEYAPFLGKLYKEKAKKKLSVTAIETLAIIAYKQPITKTEIEFIRGVNADYIMKTLLEKNLTTILGRAQTPGRPLLYGTTDEFLIQFGLNNINDLPKPREVEELLQETEKEVEKRMLLLQEDDDLKPIIKREPFDPNSRAPHIPRKKSALQLPEKNIAEIKPLEKIYNTDTIVAEEVTEERTQKSKSKSKTTSTEEKNIVIQNKPTKEVEIKNQISYSKEESPINETERPKGWMKWKQKIQGFIQKIFG